MNIDSEVDTSLIDKLYKEMTPAEKHYEAHKIAVSKYNKKNKEKKREAQKKYMNKNKHKILAKRTIAQIDDLYQKYNINLFEFNNNILDSID